jgi:hypothetical protein
VGIINQFFLLYPLHLVSQLAALAQLKGVVLDPRIPYLHSSNPQQPTSQVF